MCITPDVVISITLSFLNRLHSSYTFFRCFDTQNVSGDLLISANMVQRFLGDHFDVHESHLTFHWLYQDQFYSLRALTFVKTQMDQRKHFFGVYGVVGANRTSPHTKGMGIVCSVWNTTHPPKKKAYPPSTQKGFGPFPHRSMQSPLLSVVALLEKYRACQILLHFHFIKPLEYTENIVATKLYTYKICSGTILQTDRKPCLLWEFKKPCTAFTTQQGAVCM